jgi:hypothetical protein
MSCYTTDDTRITIKYSTITGQEPTIPLSDDHSDGTWLPTDIYIGEIFMNSQDDKLWVRTDNGITPIGGTSGSTFSFIGDYVHISGGTYSGTVYAPTFSAGGITASYIISDLFEGGTFNGTFIGDGSGLTGIVADWLGGTVSNPVHFVNTVDLNNTTYLNGDITTTNGYINITSDTWVTGGVSASYFIGDGSGLTNIPLGTQSDIYTETAALSGNSIVFTRNDTATYNVDLTPLLATQSIGLITWDEITNSLNVELVGGEVISTTIETFTNLSSLTSISAPEFYGGTYYGSFVGTYSNDIYTTSATLVGTTAIFDRTDGVTYSLDFSSIAGDETLEQTLILGNTIGTQSINFGGSANISANGTNIELKADGDIGGDLYLNSLTIADDTASGIEQISFSDISGTTRTSNISLSPGQTYEAHTINDIVFGTQQSTSTQRQTAKTVELIVDQSTGVDTEYRRELGVIGTTNGSSVKVRDNNSLEETQIKTDKSTITLQAKDLSLNDITKVEIKYNDVKISGTGSSFPGAQYDIDYSANYTNRSLVDKEYVDNAVVAGATGLGGVLAIDNTTGTQSIFISSSASQIQGYNGINQHWYNSVNSLGPYLATETGTGASGSYIRLYEGRGDTHIYNNRYYNTAGTAIDPSERALIQVRPSTVLLKGEYRDFDTNTINVNTEVSVSGQAFLTESFDDINNASAQIGGNTDGTGNTNAYLQAYQFGGLSMSQIFVRPDGITLRSDNGTGANKTTIQQSYTDIIVKGETNLGPVTFKGIEYDVDYSANFTNRSLVDKEYVDNASGSFVYITENTTTGTLTMSTPTSITSTVVDIVNGLTDTLSLDPQVLNNGTGIISEDSVSNQQVIFGVSPYSIDLIQNTTALTTANMNISSNRAFIEATDSISIIDTIYVDPLGINNITGIKSADATANTLSQTTHTPSEIILSVNDAANVNATYIDMMSTFITVEGTSPTFQGVEYVSDYSANFVNRSLVDKEYVDAQVSGATGSQSLANVLLVGATASTSIDMNGNNISEINTIGYTDGTTIDLINTINASLLTLMYNT